MAQTAFSEFLLCSEPWRCLGTPFAPAMHGMLEEILQRCGGDTAPPKPLYPRAPPEHVALWLPQKSWANKACALSCTARAPLVTLMGRAPHQPRHGSPQPPPEHPNNAPGLPCHSSSASLSSTSWAPAPWITQAPMSYGNGHERKRLNRFSLLEQTALPAALGLGTRPCWRCPKVPQGAPKAGGLGSAGGAHLPSPVALLIPPKP